MHTNIFILETRQSLCLYSAKMVFSSCHQGRACVALSQNIPIKYTTVVNGFTKFCKYFLLALRHSSAQLCVGIRPRERRSVCIQHVSPCINRLIAEMSVSVSG